MAEKILWMTEKIFSAIKAMVIIMEQNCSMMRTKSIAPGKAYHYIKAMVSLAGNMVYVMLRIFLRLRPWYELRRSVSW
jgi:hypothetical protein